jgi:hypothetical protein
MKSMAAFDDSHRPEITRLRSPLNWTRWFCSRDGARSVASRTWVSSLNTCPAASTSLGCEAARTAAVASSRVIVRGNSHVASSACS